MTNINRSKVAAKIRALLGKTVDNGATEEEALTAALKARELMDRYGINVSEAELLEEGFDGQDSSSDDPERILIQKTLGYGVSLFTETHVWIAKREQSDCAVQHDLFGGKRADYYSSRKYNTLHFFGLQSDVVFAVWLIQMLETFVKRAANKYIAELNGAIRSQKTVSRRDFAYSSAGNKRAHSYTYKDLLLKRQSFIVGAARRINERLIEEYHKRHATRSRGTGRDLVVNKQSLIEFEMKKRGIIISNKHKKTVYRIANPEAFQAGNMKGNEASFERPINGSGLVRQIAR